MLKKTAILIALSLFFVVEVNAQNWSTHCGNNERNGISELPGPKNINTPLWTIGNATPTGLGMNIYSFGDLFVTSRVDFSPYNAIIECRNLMTGALVWTSPNLGAASILFAIGFNEDAVYAHDYHSNLIYALHASDGSVKWVSDFESYTFGPMDGVIFTCNRDIIINGGVGSNESTLCLNKETGEIRWANLNWFAVTPNETKAAHGDRLYMITGAITQPIKLVAVDMETGENLYYSESLPGDGDQEGPIAVSPDGTIYFRRDGGNLFAIADNGSGFDILWTRTPINMGPFFMNYGIDPKGNLLLMDNGKIYRLNKSDGSPMDSSLVNTFNSGRITVDSDSVVYVNNTEGDYYALTYDLQTTLWSTLTMNGNYYAGPSISKEGIMVMCGAGNSIKAYKYNGTHAPVADFEASRYHIYTGQSVAFHDKSSFSPSSWNWEFTGGNPPNSTDMHPMGIYYDEPGSYPVKLIATNESGTDTVTKMCYIEVELYEGVEPHTPLVNTRISPNPVREFAVLSSDEASEISIFNSIGKVVYQDKKATRERRINFSDFSSGIYFVQFTGDGFTRSEKLVVGN